jgi:hypothetical protein
MSEESGGEPGASEVMSLLLGDDELEEQCNFLFLLFLSSVCVKLLSLFV